MTLQMTDPDLPVNVQESLGRCGSTVACCRVRGTECSSVNRGPFKGGPIILGASLVAQMVKHLLTMWETWVRSLGWEDPLEKGIATHSSIHAWKIPWTKETGGLQSMGSQRVGHN